IAVEIQTIIAEMSGLEVSALDPAATFTELGFDSLFLTQANAQVRRRFGVRVTLGQLLGEASTIAALAGYIDSELEPEGMPAPTPMPVAATHGAVDGAPSPADAPRPLVAVPLMPGSIDVTHPDGVAWLVMEQLRVMDEQLELVRAHLGQTSGAAIDVTPDA